MSEHNRLIERCLQLQNENKLLKQHKSELIELITHLKYNAGLDEFSENYIDETLNKYSGV